MKNILSYFSVGTDNKHREVFFITFDFGNLITKYTGNKNPDHPTFIL